MINSKPCVALVRGPWLNPFEMQTYTLLQSDFNLICIAARDNLFETGRISLPIVRLHQPREVGFDIPKWRGFANLVTRRLLGSEDRMLGLEKALSTVDLAHVAETVNYFSLQAIRVKAKTGARVAVTVWENLPFNYEDSPHFKSIKDEVRRNADCFLAVTQQARNALCLEGVPDERIRVIGAGINTERFAPGPPDLQLRRRLGVHDSARVVLFVGSLLRAKGVYHLIEAARSVLRSQSCSVHFLLVGRGPEESSLRNEIEQRGLSRHVTIAGSLPYTELPAAHRLADVFVLPSIPTPTWEEQFGMVLAESMATGKPVVATRSGAIPEVVGPTGLLTPPGDPIALAEAIQRVLGDDTLSRSLGEAARQRVLDLFDHRVVAAKIASAYRETLR